MEQDRLEANLGQFLEFSQEIPASTKNPKRRFVGRRTAVEQVENQNGRAEHGGLDKGAIAGS